MNDRSTRRHCGVLMVLLALIVASAACAADPTDETRDTAPLGEAAQVADAPDLVTRRVQLGLDEAQQPGVVRTDFVELDLTPLSPPPGAMDGGRLVLDAGRAIRVALFDDVEVLIDLDAVEVAADRTVAWSGTVASGPGGRAVLVALDGELTANITLTGGGLYEIRPGLDNTHRVQQIDTAGLPPELEPRIPELPGAAADPPPDPDPVDSGELDVMVVYTAAAELAAGGEQAMRALVRLAVVEANEGYRMSDVPLRMNVVRVMPVDYVEENSQTYDMALEAIAAQGDGEMDWVHEERDAVCADVVSLWIEDTEACGLAYVMRQEGAGFESQAFSVVYRRCAAGNYSFAHEVGHNLGSMHDRSSSVFSGVRQYSYGYRDPAGEFRTIMAYACPGGCRRENRWSNPEQTWANGSPLGIAIGDPAAAHNAASLASVVDTAVNWRRSARCSDDQ